MKTIQEYGIVAVLHKIRRLAVFTRTTRLVIYSSNVIARHTSAKGPGPALMALATHRLVTLHVEKWLLSGIKLIPSTLSFNKDHITRFPPSKHHNSNLKGIMQNKSR